MTEAPLKAFDVVQEIVINNRKTNFALKRFANKQFVVITQRQKMSNIFTAKFEVQEDFPVLSGTTPLSITHKFGEDTDEVRSAIRFIITNSKLKTYGMEVVISLNLQEIDGKVLKEITAAIDKFM